MKLVKECVILEESVDLPTDIFIGKHKFLNGILFCTPGMGKLCILAKQKHSMSAAKIGELAKRDKLFRDLISKSSQWDTFRPYLGRTIVGEAFGTDFPEECRAPARHLNKRRVQFVSHRHRNVWKNLEERDRLWRWIGGEKCLDKPTISKGVDPNLIFGKSKCRDLPPALRMSTNSKAVYSELATKDAESNCTDKEHKISVDPEIQTAAVISTALVTDDGLPKEGVVKIYSARQSIANIADRKSQVRRAETGKTIRVAQEKFISAHAMTSSGIILPSIMYYNLAHVVVGVAGTLMLDATVTTSIWALRQQVGIDLVSSSADFELVDTMFGLSNALDVYKVAYQWISSVAKLPKQERRLRRTNTPKQIIYCLSMALVVVICTIVVEATMDWEPVMTPSGTVPCSEPLFSMDGLNHFLKYNDGLTYVNGVVDMLTSSSLGNLQAQTTIGVYKWSEAKNPGTQQLILNTLGYSIEVACSAANLSAQQAELIMDNVGCTAISCAFNVTLHGYGLNSTEFDLDDNYNNNGTLAQCQVTLDALEITLQITYLVGPKLRTVMQQNTPLSVNSIGFFGSGFLAQRAIQSMNREMFTKSPGMTGGIANWLKLGSGELITSTRAQQSVTGAMAGSLFMISQSYMKTIPRSCTVLSVAGAGNIIIPYIAIWATIVSVALWLLLMFTAVTTASSDTLLSTPAVVARGTAALTSGVRFAALLNESQPFTELCQNICDATPSEVRKRIGHQRIMLGADRQPVGDRPGHISFGWEGGLQNIKAGGYYT
ncbi:UNVERIFIED_CONTAM: hypothetical protein HDU68_001539 [Siphonaria sp. JEL0065]|nr:hypothetical protein HDU68_001539 [Siphonaria sp. JEL0065]